MITDILIEPTTGKFDISKIATYLEGQPNTARDEVREDIFIVADSPEELKEVREARRRDSRQFPTTVILIELGDRIEISYRTVHVGAARRFVEWLRQQYDVKFFDEAFNDLTDSCTKNLDYLFSSA
jgi:hypothetical protein